MESHVSVALNLPYHKQDWTHEVLQFMMLNKYVLISTQTIGIQHISYEEQLSNSQYSLILRVSVHIHLLKQTLENRCRQSLRGAELLRNLSGIHKTYLFIQLTATLSDEEEKKSY